ncbi:MAG: tRNA (adenosine(37)-N6)-threonylcarbamoyltransferase complex transferase subunit TsaD, partial [Candidatus Limnocylindrales bacterium]
DFSFSGLKSAVRRLVTEEAGGTADDGVGLPAALVAEVADAFQASVVEVLARKTLRAAEACAARTIVLGGGVAANAVLRARVADGAAALGMPLIVPRPGLCTDNGAMIGAAGFLRARAGVRAGWDLDARPSLRLAA